MTDQEVTDQELYEFVDALFIVLGRNEAIAEWVKRIAAARPILTELLDDMVEVPVGYRNGDFCLTHDEYATLRRLT